MGTPKFALMGHICVLRSDVFSTDYFVAFALTGAHFEAHFEAGTPPIRPVLPCDSSAL